MADSSGVAKDNFVVRHVSSDHRAGADDDVAANPNSWEHHRADRDEREITNLDAARESGSRRNMHTVSQDTFVINARPRIDDARFADPRFGADG